MDAFYMTLITITTVGYSEIHPLSSTGRLFNSVLILYGVVALAVFGLASLTRHGADGSKDPAATEMTAKADRNHVRR